MYDEYEYDNHNSVNNSNDSKYIHNDYYKDDWKDNHDFLCVLLFVHLERLSGFPYEGVFLDYF